MPASPASPPSSTAPAAVRLPRPGPRWGQYPLRQDLRPPSDQPALALARWPAPDRLPARWALAWHRGWLARVHQGRARLAGAMDFNDSAACQAQVKRTRQRLRREGLHAESLAEALALLALLIEHRSGKALHDTQLLAAASLLDHRAIELATGEGKSLAMAAAAAVAALAGVPTHVVTANDYLARRDAQAGAPLWRALGLQVAHIDPADTPAQRRARYAHDIVFATAKELAFDHLRDCLAAAGSGHETPVMRGLSLALLDEVDSILLDEAVVPLRISGAHHETPAHQGQRRALWWQAWQLAGQLHLGEHAQPGPVAPQVVLTPAGRARLAELTAALSGLWRRAQAREALAELALTAAHGLHRDQHYLVQDGAIALLDTLTGRIATGRVWSQGLQALIERKEGCPHSPPTETLAQLTFQRFFQRYWRLGGLSGTVREARHELQAVYGLRTRCLPPRQPSRRQHLPPRVFATPEARWAAVAERVAVLQAQSRPVLIGTDAVADSERLSWHLTQAGIAHAVLNARHHEAEAAILAQAGRAGSVTVSTRMAGRGTDITPDDEALAAGGLHVIDCQHNASRRLDRQLWGRCARQGQPGSTETWLCAGLSAHRATPAAPKLLEWTTAACHHLDQHAPAWRLALRRLTQWLQAQQQAAMRARLLAQDRQWDKQQQLARRPDGPR